MAKSKKAVHKKLLPAHRLPLEGLTIGGSDDDGDGSRRIDGHRRPRNRREGKRMQQHIVG